MKKTTVGFEIKAVGLNPFASRYAGMSSKKNIIISMLLSGAFSGLGGVVQGLGTYQNYFTQTTSLDIGWDGLSVALLGGGTAIGILLAAIIFFIAINYVIGLLFKTKKNRSDYYIPTRKEKGPNNGVDGPGRKVIEGEK